jgi:UDP-glucose 4-epimerase
MIVDKKIFITGGAGFISTRLIQEIIHQNSIVVYDNFHRDTLSNSNIANHPNLTIIRGSVLDYPKLEQAMRGADIVVHAAAIAGIDTVIKSPTGTMRVNMMGTAKALEAARVNKVSDRFINFSTSEVFGSYAYKTQENSNTVVGSAGEARWTYAVSKLAAEHMAMAYHHEFQLPVVNVRPFNVYGAGQTGEGALQIFITRALQNEEINIYGDGSQIRSWCYIDDFIDGLMRCIENPAAIGESFNIGNARAVLTTYGLAQTVCRVLGSDSPILHKPPLSADVELRIPSIEKAVRILGFEAKTAIDEGILKTAEWMKTHNRMNQLAFI